jgi:hypothetical protein
VGQRQLLLPLVLLLLLPPLLLLLLLPGISHPPKKIYQFVSKET